MIPNHQWNKSVAESWNYGLSRARGYDYALVVNDDIVFCPYLIDRLVVAYEYFDDLIMVTGTNYRDRGATPEEVLEMNEIWDGEREIGPDFCCFLVEPKKILDVVGYFDENIRPAYFEDNDYHYRIQLSGYEAMHIPTAAIYHFGSQTQNHNNNPIVKPEMYRKNQEYYREKWGSDPKFEPWKHPYNNESLTWRDWRGNPYGNDN